MARTTRRQKPRVALYLRISDDRDGTQTATVRQRADCEKFASAKGWEVVDVFEDVDLSAWSRRVKRPQFERMLGVIQAGEVDIALAWKFDRVLRSIRDFARLKDAAEDNNVYLVDMHGVDTSTPTGRMQAGMMAVFAEAESENISIRVMRKHQERAEAGKPITGGRRTFGYSPDLMSVIPEEAALIREAADRVFAGETAHGIAVDLNRRGVRTTAGNDWRPRTLRRLLVSAKLSAQREYQGAMTPGVWPAILKPADTRRLRAILNDPVRRKAVQGRKYLLSGLLSCGLCDAPLVSHPCRGRVQYVCRSFPGEQGCGKIARLTEPVDAMVKEAVCSFLDAADLQPYVEVAAGDFDIDQTVTEIEACEDRLRELSEDFYQHRLIERAEFFRHRSALHDRLKELRADLARKGSRGVIADLSGSEAREQWDARGQDWQRAVISAVVEAIAVDPARRGQQTFDPSKIRITFKS